MYIKILGVVYTFIFQINLNPNFYYELIFEINKFIYKKLKLIKKQVVHFFRLQLHKNESNRQKEV